MASNERPYCEAHLPPCRAAAGPCRLRRRGYAASARRKARAVILHRDCRPSGFLIAPRGWERVGDVSNVVFTNGAIADDDGKLYIYYGASDTRLHVATTTVDKMLDFAFNTPADPLRSRDCVAQRVALIEKNLEFLKK